MSKNKRNCLLFAPYRGQVRQDLKTTVRRYPIIRIKIMSLRKSKRNEESIPEKTSLHGSNPNTKQEMAWTTRKTGKKAGLKA